MAIYELVLRQEYFGQEVINRWNYVSQGTPAAVSGSFALVSAIGAISLAAASMIGRVRQLQNTQVNFIDVEARNVYSTTDFYTRPFASDTNGQGGSLDPASPFISFGFRTNRVRTDIRRATKRFVGVSEGDMIAGGDILPATLVLMEDLAGYMSDVLEYNDEGNLISFSPCVISKEKYTTPAGNEAYRYYASEAAQLANTATGVLWSPYTTVRTQTSRQYGRGR